MCSPYSMVGPTPKYNNILIQIIRCKQDKLNNLITLSKLEQVYLKQQQQNPYKIVEH